MSAGKNSSSFTFELGKVKGKEGKDPDDFADHDVSPNGIDEASVPDDLHFSRVFLLVGFVPLEVLEQVLDCRDHQDDRQRHVDHGLSVRDGDRADYLQDSDKLCKSLL